MPETVVIINDTPGQAVTVTAGSASEVVEVNNSEDTHSHVIGETPAGAMNGSNAIFTSAHVFVPETVEVFINGVRLKIVEDYNLSLGTTITMVSSPASTEYLLINYIKV